jgi:sec-independent protein translocase protein TatA
MLPNIGWFEMMMLLGVAVLLFGKRLPEVGRSLGKGIVEFKKGLSGAVDEFDISGTGTGTGTGTGRSSWMSGSSTRASDKPVADSAYTESSVPKFELPGTVSNSQPEMEYQPAPRD